MILGRKVLGVVGARSGSKGIKDKNIKLFLGRPLMWWIIDCARRTQVIDKIIVSTDSQEYARLAESFGAEAPFLRPKNISGNYSTDLEYIEHALQWLEKCQGYVPQIVIRLLPTTPLQSPGDIDKSVNLLINNEAMDSVFVIAKSRSHPEKALKIKKEESGSSYLVDYITGKPDCLEPVARQDFDTAYVRANAIATRTDTIKKFRSLSGKRVGYVVIPENRAVDIDSEIDFLASEQIARKYFNENR